MESIDECNAYNQTYKASVGWNGNDTDATMSFLATPKVILQKREGQSLPFFSPFLVLPCLISISSECKC